MVIILAGAIGRFPVGGQAWCEMQYLLGLRDLGHEVYFLEDCGEESWVYNWETQEVTTELDYPTTYVRECLEPVGLDGRWMYRAGDRCVGMPHEEFREVCSQADLMIVRGAAIPIWRAEYDLPRRRIFIDSDPGFVQISLANGDPALSGTLARCERVFTIAQRIGAPDCAIPTVGREWLKTVFPVALSHWPVADDGTALPFTSIMQWRSYREVVHEGVSYGNKDREFPTFIDLPRLSAQTFRIALTGAPPEVLTEHGWEVVPGWEASQSVSSYRAFIQNSRAEFGVAKHAYVLTRSGWFSDRSICYLASGRPVIAQDTGLEGLLPHGTGLLTFSSYEEATDAVARVRGNYAANARAARALAEEAFGSDTVLRSLLDRVA